MGVVEVLSKTRMLAIEAMSVVSGAISGDNLVLTRHDGTEINAGNVRGLPGTGPTGSIAMFAGASAPAGHLLCDGSLVSRSAYSTLFGVIGTAYGVGDGTTTFALPNLKGKVPVGRDSADTQFDVLGETGGAKTHTLTAAEMPVHTHTQNAHTHVQDAHNHTQNSHGHTQNSHDHTIAAHAHAADSGTLGYTAAFATGTKDGITNNATAFGRTTGSSTPNIGSSTATNVATTPTNVAATATNQSATATNQNAGNGDAHNNLQPYIVMNYIIKT